VVAMANDWVGGEGPGKYRHGGLTPRAGNGVIVYDPNSRKYYTYLHLHDVVVVPGQIVSPGTPLGHGGNTGTNARKRGHGGHLHLEIFDAVQDDTLSCYELREIILSLRP
jgi:murein DD-endopeptidase MepM/ murein hydrolase activator NlpD